MTLIIRHNLNFIQILKCSQIKIECTDEMWGCVGRIFQTPKISRDVHFCCTGV